jgi:hypothetical protein
VSLRRQDMTMQRRFEEMDSWLEHRGFLQRIPMGRGELLYLPSAGKVHRAIVEALLSEPMFLTAAYNNGRSTI